jgi:DNA-binding MarR family transcriptional regulator
MASATSIMRVQQLLLGDFDAAVGRHGLTFARYEALVLLAFSRQGRLPMSKIGRRLMVHPTSVTNIIQRLAAQGLVERTPNPDDGRGMLASITPRGREVMESATKELLATGFSLGALTEAEHEQLSLCSARSASRPAISAGRRVVRPPFTSVLGMGRDI